MSDDAEKAAEAHLHKTYFAVQNNGVLQRARSDFLAGYAAAQQWRGIESAPSGKNGVCFMQLQWGTDEHKCSGNGMRLYDKFYAAAVFHTLIGDKPFCFTEIEVKPTGWLPLPPSE